MNIYCCFISGSKLEFAKFQEAKKQSVSKRFSYIYVILRSAPSLQMEVSLSIGMRGKGKDFP